MDAVPAITLVTVGCFVGILAFGMLAIVQSLRDLHHALNSRLDELVKTTARMAHSEGFAEGRQGRDNLQDLKDFKELESGR